MFVIDLRSDLPARVRLSVGQRVRIDLSERGAGIVTGVVTSIDEDAGRVQISGRDLPVEWVPFVAVIGPVGAQVDREITPAESSA